MIVSFKMYSHKNGDKNEDKWRNLFRQHISLGILQKKTAINKFMTSRTMWIMKHSTVPSVMYKALRHIKPTISSQHSPIHNRIAQIWHLQCGYAYCLQCHEPFFFYYCISTAIGTTPQYSKSINTFVWYLCTKSTTTYILLSLCVDCRATFLWPL